MKNVPQRNTIETSHRRNSSVVTAHSEVKMRKTHNSSAGTQCNSKETKVLVSQKGTLVDSETKHASNEEEVIIKGTGIIDEINLKDEGGLPNTGSKTPRNFNEPQTAENSSEKRFKEDINTDRTNPTVKHDQTDHSAENTGRGDHDSLRNQTGLKPKISGVVRHYKSIHISSENERNQRSRNMLK